MDTRRSFLKKLIFGAVATAVPEVVEGAKEPYPGVKNYSHHKRGNRSKTTFIVLHTTEGKAAGDLAIIRASGSAHYLVEKNGTITRTLPHSMIGEHAGHSIWNGVKHLNRYSVGIETEGDHCVPPTTQQLQSLKWLIAALRKIYPGIPDENVVTHSMVRYEPPNKYHKTNHRFRACGMLFALAPYRKAIGLNNVFRADPDVATGKYIFADKYLAEVLFSPVTPPIYRIASWDDRDPRADAYVRSLRGKPAVAKAHTKAVAVLVKPKIRNKRLYRLKENAYATVGTLYNNKSTHYAFKGKDRWVIFSGSEYREYEKVMPAGTFIGLNYSFGIIGKGKGPYSVATKQWNNPQTLYFLPDGTEYFGDEVTPELLPPHTTVLFPN